MTIALVSLIGIITGALLQYFFTSHLENQRHYRDLRTKAYMDYLKVISENAQENRSGSPNPANLHELSIRVTDAKARICLYGSKKVIRAFAVFDKLGAKVITDEQRKAIIEMLLAMRSDSGGHSGVDTKDLEIMMLGQHKEPHNQEAQVDSQGTQVSKKRGS
jgi:hypothetical protein